MMMDTTIVRVNQHGADAKGVKQASDRTFPRRLTARIHAVVDALGNPLRFELTPGQSHDSVMGYEMISTLDIQKREVCITTDRDTEVFADPADLISEILRLW
ncbi:transposase [Paenibacillus sp. CN-4]|uniref:transposase n=1 Tax=Paenibacillus nanchangensis TaxID=3348343 RepID=UPI00397DE344